MYYCDDQFCCGVNKTEMFLLQPFCRNFTVFLDKEYGNCFQFNGFDGHRKTPLKAREAGVVHGTSSVTKLFTYGVNADF